jgi:1-pyrroline-5-carboxylate dehydrogenase
MLTEFTNEALTDFSQPAHAQAFETALLKVKEGLGRKHPAWIGGKEIFESSTGREITSRDPGETETVIGTYTSCGVEEAEQAMQAALTAFDDWSMKPAATRAQYLFDAAKLMRERKHEFSAMMVYEVGKNRVEADADTAEAIDFLEFYGREALRYAAEQPVTPIPGEKNELIYIPLGVGIVIPPWNFPLAILAGMTTAALVSGNTVVLKPASDSPGIASMFTDLMREVGIPAGVLNFLPGPGAVAGEYLVKHPKTRFISFTGSRDVGLGIIEKAAQLQEGQIWIKRVVAEMGGKDAILVDETADLDAAADGIVAAAFGYSGQKCSACSRAILHQDIYDEVLEKIVAKTKNLKVTHPSQADASLGPVSSENAYKKILDYIEIGKNEGRLVCGGEIASGNGYYIQPTVIADIAPDARIAQEEIFGPVLAVMKAKDYEEGVSIFNGTVYGLTGALFSKDPSRLTEAKRRLHAGNLYLNRKCTGALVGGQPFGGFNMSGTDSKAGGRDYLLLFLQGKSISERC